LFEPLWFWSAAVVLVCRHWPLCVWRLASHQSQKNNAGLTLGEDVDRRGHPSCDAILRRIEMTPFLILARAAIIGWTTLAVFPLEITFNAVEGELKRQGVEL
jgi:hypothetical protein